MKWVALLWKVIWMSELDVDLKRYKLCVDQHGVDRYSDMKGIFTQDAIVFINENDLVDVNLDDVIDHHGIIFYAHALSRDDPSIYGTYYNKGEPMLMLKSMMEIADE